MLRSLSLGLVLASLFALPLRATNPDDIEFHLRLVKDSSIYHAGESIEFEISSSSASEKKYFGSFSAPYPTRDAGLPRISPAEGVVDLRELRRDEGFGGSYPGSVGYLGAQPNTQKFDLAQWYRFQKPGHYSVVVTSTEVSRLNDAGGRENLTLESNGVELDILPADPIWIAGEMSDIEMMLGTRRQATGWQRLAFLDTPASVERLVQVYLANSDGLGEMMLRKFLHDSLQIDTIVPMLEAALSDPTAKIPETLPVLFAELQTRKELGVVPPYPDDPAGQQRWNEEWTARSKTRDKYVAQANRLLEAGLEHRSGTERAQAIYQLWMDGYMQTGVTVTEARRLLPNVLAISGDLDIERQRRFIEMAWDAMPHEQLLPLVRKIASESNLHSDSYWDNGMDAYERWCQASADECSAAILADVLESKAKTSSTIVLYIPEAEHPELDKMLEAQLKDVAAVQDAAPSQRDARASRRDTGSFRNKDAAPASDVRQSRRTAAAVLRAGSRNLVPAVDRALDRLAGTHGCSGQVEGYLLGYLFRVAPDDGAKRLSAVLMNKADSCGTEVLRTLHSARPSDDLIPIVSKALDAPNLGVAQTAALYLGDSGPPSSQDALWRRLEAVWNARPSRPAEPLQSLSISGAEATDPVTALEPALASALSHARNWKLSPAELDRLRSGCLTQECRDVADGKKSYSL